ncbi:hypothetical protein GGR57DRAFT_359861 [Xylariaceae sp. FL1272]|nr:hypothetical protein GGR57DRAFT_359861 [Xylariaceae sp. FL1272]
MDDNAAEDHKTVVETTNGEKQERISPIGFRPMTESAKADEETEAHQRPDLSPGDSSSVSSVNPDMLGDEIIVGTHSNGDKQSPLRVVSEDGEDEDVIPHYPKRKRSTVYNDLGEDKMDTSMTEEVPETNTPRTQSVVPRPMSARERDQKGVILGYWRDSPVPSPAGKHSVIGFMDVRDRLRTRIQHLTRTSEVINARLFPIPPGPGGSWVTFERIVFSDHLIGLDHNEIKEYVKLRYETQASDTLDNRADMDQAAVVEARRRVRDDPPPEQAQPPAIAWGLDIPEHAQMSRQEAKRRRIGSGVGPISDRTPNHLSQQLPVAHPTPTPNQTVAVPTPPTQPPYPGMLDSLPGTRPTRILVGCWSKSDVEDDRERHAVYGILGANDMFRVKLVRETLDGRYVDGNFPAGAGALWIPYEEVLFLRHINHLSRPEMKEYVRVRQSQIDAGEKEDDKVANETKAVYEAQTRVASMTRGGQPVTASMMSRSATMIERDDGPEQLHTPTSAGGHELRHNRREVREVMPRNELPGSRHPLPDPAHLARPASIDPVERVQTLATREVSRLEAVQMRNDRHNQSRFPMPAPNPNAEAEMQRQRFQDDRERMQKVWASQEQNRFRPGVEETKVHMGVKYERKSNGPWKGKLVSQGSILTIDGEDYVEYRVLTKPTFF